MAARRLIGDLVRQEVSHNFNQMQANGFGKSGLTFVDKKEPCRTWQGRMGRGSLDLVQTNTRIAGIVVTKRGDHP
jgi:hypothetical protein